MTHPINKDLTKIILEYIKGLILIKEYPRNFNFQGIKLTN